MSGFDLEAEGISLVGVGGKTNLDKPMVIFEMLGIDTYVVFDCDEDKKESEQKSAYNLQLQKLCQYENPTAFQTTVQGRFASFKTNLETVLRQEIGAEEFDHAVGQAAYMYGLDHASVKKCPAPMAHVLNVCNKKGFRSETLENIVKALFGVAK